MPKALLDKLPKAAQDIYEKVWAETDGDDATKAKAAIGAVKNAGYRKGKSGKWVKMAESMDVFFGAILGEGEWIEVACTGTVTDMNGHQVTIDDSDIDFWERAFSDNLRNQEIPITIDHPKQGGVAAGWVRGFKKGPRRTIRGEDRTTFLMKPEWTPTGEKIIGGKEYQYTSLEIQPDNVVRAVSLVNFPAIKGLNTVTQPVQLSEEFLSNHWVLLEEGKMEKCPKCGADVPEDAKTCPECGYNLESSEKEEKKMSEKQVLTLAEAQELRAEIKRLSEERDQMKEQQDDISKKLGAAEGELQKLQSQNVELSEQTNRLVELNNMMRLHEKVTDFMSLSEDPSKAIAPAYEEKIIGFMLNLSSPEEEQEFLELLGALATDDAYVLLGELGSSETPESFAEGSSIRDQMHKEAVKLSEKEQIPYKDALRRVSERREV